MYTIVSSTEQGFLVYITEKEKQMIHMKKGDARVKTDSEELAKFLEEQGFTRIRGWRKLGLVIKKSAKKTLLDFVLPGAFALALFHFSGGRDYTAFIAAIFLFYIMHDLLRQ